MEKLRELTEVENQYIQMLIDNMYKKNNIQEDEMLEPIMCAISFHTNGYNKQNNFILWKKLEQLKNSDFENNNYKYIKKGFSKKTFTLSKENKTFLCRFNK